MFVQMSDLPIGIILCAGSQKRFSQNIAKPLVPFGLNGMTTLEINILNLSKFTQKIFVVIKAEEDASDFERVTIKFPLTKLIRIDSGKGDAHGLAQAILKIENIQFKNAILCWGDSIQYEPLITKNLLNHQLFGTEIVVPCVWENEPYVKLCPKTKEDHRIEAVQQKKWGQWDGKPGWHDLSIFSIPVEKFMSAYDAYSSLQRVEYSLMDMLSQGFFPEACILPIEFPCEALSYNTDEELKEVQNKFLNIQTQNRLTSHETHI